jgi:hypothetical protein
MLLALQARLREVKIEGVVGNKGLNVTTGMPHRDLDGTVENKVCECFHATVMDKNSFLLRTKIHDTIQTKTQCIIKEYLFVISEHLLLCRDDVWLVRSDVFGGRDFSKALRPKLNVE